MISVSIADDRRSFQNSLLPASNMAVIGGSAVTGEDSSSATDSSPFMVLGVALVVDQVGHGAHMAFRYPVAPLLEEKVNDDFFRLSPRQMAKLFRPKPPLCGQAITLSIGGTLFCCYATLLANEGELAADGKRGGAANFGGSSNTSSNSDLDSMGASEHSQLSLFSIVVALAPRAQTSTAADASIRQTNYSLFDVPGKLGLPAPGEVEEAMPSYQCFRRVHVSLARLSRVLLREERRCQYVSLQCRLFRRIRAGLHRARQQQQPGTAAGGGGGTKALPTGATPGPSSPASGTSKTVGPPAVPSAPPSTGGPAGEAAAPPGHQRRPSLNRRPSWNMEREVNERPPAPPDAERHHPAAASGGTTPASGDPDEEDQEAVEAILALSPLPVGSGAAPADASPLSGDFCDLENEGDDSTNSLPFPDNELSLLLERGHQGNLAQELVDFFHALAQTADFDLTPRDVAGGDGIIYINRHIAVAVKGVPRPVSSEATRIVLRPYHTLVFPKASPTQIIKSLNAAAPRLNQLLSMVNPQKSIKNIAMDANLPLSAAMELATYLISQGVCLPSPTVTRSSIFGCPSVSALHAHTLEFLQRFGTSVNLFVLVSFLTSGRTLGECMNALTSSSPDGEAPYLRHQMEATLRPDTEWKGREGDLENAGRIEELEEMFFTMVVWLRSKLIIMHVLEFLVAVDAPGLTVTAPSSSEEQGEKKSETTVTAPDANTGIWHGLFQGGYLNGTTSMQSCCWRVQMEYHRLKASAVRHESIRIVSRVPGPSDDV